MGRKVTRFGCVKSDFGRMSQTPTKDDSFEHFLASLALTIGAPFLAPICYGLGGRPFELSDWMLFLSMYLISFASSTRSFLIGILSLLFSTIFAVYAGANMEHDKELQVFGISLSIMFFLTTAILTLGQIFEKYRVHVTGKERMWSWKS
jgi:hypothetical protein